MKVVYERKFLKDVEKIKDGKILKRIQATLEDLEQIVDSHSDRSGMPEIHNMIKLKGHDQFYRIRIGDYRLGASIEITKL